jgi:hypothetical protein
MEKGFNLIESDPAVYEVKRYIGLLNLKEISEAYFTDFRKTSEEFIDRDTKPAKDETGRRTC